MKQVILHICVFLVIYGTAQARVELEKGVNQVQNWDFEQGFLGLCITYADSDEPNVRRCVVPDVWGTEDYTPERNGRIELDDKEAFSGNFSLKVTNTSLGEVDWDFKVEQSNMSFEAGEKHTIKFWAKAEAPREVIVCLQMSHEPYEGYLYRNINLAQSWREFAIETIPEKDNDREHWLAFHCGQSLVTWWLDDVRYYKGSPDDEKESEPRPRRAWIESLNRPKPSALHVEGSKLKDANGNIVRLQGVNVPTLEYTNTGGDLLFETLRVAIQDWNVNTIRMPLCPERWLGKENTYVSPDRLPAEEECQSDCGKLHRLVVDEVVKYIAENGCYVIFDIHGFRIKGWRGLFDMPDMTSVEFWKSVASHYANDPAVLFDLYNETHDVSWNVWKFGGSVTIRLPDRTTYTYMSPGMQELLDVVRSSGAENVVVAGGLEWGYCLRGIPEYALDDPCGNVIYGTHIYPWKGHEKDWDNCIGHVIGKYPILVGEVGCEPDEDLKSVWPDYDPYNWSVEVLSYIHKHELNWTAWCFDTDAGPPILEDWTYKPTPFWGAFVKKALMPVPYIGDEIPPWDINEDGRVDILDLVLVGRDYGRLIAASLYANPDVNGDGKVDMSDLVLVAEHLGEVYVR